MTALATSSAPVPALREGHVFIYDTGIGVWEEHVDEAGGMHSAMHSLMLRMRHQRGWRILSDKKVAKSIRHNYYRGRKGDLELRITLCGRHLELNFYQNVIFENRNGGEHDFDKYRRMPRAMRLQCVVEASHVLRKLVELGYTWQPHHHRGPPGDGLDPRDLLAVARAMDPDGGPRHGTLERFNAGWNSSEYDRKHGGRFERDETGWPSATELDHWPRRDRDGVKIENGSVRYVRYRGRLMRGVVRPNMNDMWSVGDFTYETARELFLCDDPAAEPRRLVPGQRKRLKAELTKALEREDFRRCEGISRALRRLA